MKVCMEVLPPTLAANSLACSIEDARTASAMLLCATSTPWLALSASYTCFNIAASMRRRSSIGMGVGSGMMTSSGGRVVALLPPTAEHVLNLDLDGTADIAPNILAYRALRVRGQRYDNLTGRSPASLDMIEIFDPTPKQCFSFTSRKPAAA